MNDTHGILTKIDMINHCELINHTKLNNIQIFTIDYEVYSVTVKSMIMHVTHRAIANGKQIRYKIKKYSPIIPGEEARGKYIVKIILI